MMSHVVYRCPMGLVDSATPIIIDGVHLGNVFTGQMFIDPPDETQFVEQAHRYGFDEAKYLEAVRKVPYFSEAHQRASEPLLASVDKTHLQQVFVNLASNARDAMSSGGRLSIHLERMAMDNAFVQAHGFGAAGPYALITVSDTGAGVAHDHIHKIFEPFFTTKAEGKETGLGLAIVYGIITQHHGFITCYSEQGIGTTFNIYLPLVGDAAQSLESPSEEKITSSGNLTILLVEDDPAVRKVTQSILKVHGHSVIEAEHGKQALEIFRQHHAAIHLVILDAIMPEMNGVETLVSLQEIVPDVKALFMSGYAPDILCGKMKIPDNVVFLNKPVIPARLMEAIRKTMEKAKGFG